jgi:hypothetical protein
MGWSPSRKTGLLYKDDRSFGGYTVIVPNGGDDSYLLGPDGTLVHEWHVPWFRPGYAYLTPEGTLLARGQQLQETDKGWESVPNKADILVELDWDSNVVLKWDKADLHHGIYRMPGGNTLIIIWTPLPDGFHERIKGGMAQETWDEILEKDPDFWDFILEGMGVGGRPKLDGHYGDAIIEIDPGGNIVKQWNVYDHVSPEEEPTCSFCPGAEWTHANCVEMTADGKVLVSFREISKVMIIDWDTGEVVWNYGRPVISHQHDPNETPDGNIMIFDNGAHHPIQGRSRVIEVDPKTDKIVWQYSGSPVFCFRCLHIGGAQRLPNGNTMICEGECGRLIEVTPDKEICWEWINPFVHPFKDQPNTQIFKTRTYAPDSPELAGRDLSGAACEDVNRKSGLLNRAVDQAAG